MRQSSEIKRRRQARIEQLKQMLVRSDGEPPDRSRAQAGQHSERGAYRAGASYSEKSTDSLQTNPPADPEEAWKRKMASWSGQPYRERYGFLADGPSRRSAVWRLPAWGGFSLTSFLLSILLFLVTWGVFQLPISWAGRAQEVIAEALQEPFRTEQAAAWYAKRFGGSPSWIPIWQSADGGQADVQAVHTETLLSLQAPVFGQIVTPFAANEQGVQIQIAQDEPIRAAAEGRVLFLGTTSMGTTIVLQHPDQIQTVYACLDAAAVKVHDWVEQGDVLAWGVEERHDSRVLYFSIRAGEQYMDPAVVVRFD